MKLAKPTDVIDVTADVVTPHAYDARQGIARAATSTSAPSVGAGVDDHCDGSISVC